MCQTLRKADMIQSAILQSQHWAPESSALSSGSLSSLETKFLHCNRECRRQCTLKINSHTVESNGVSLHSSFIIVLFSYCCVTNYSPNSVAEPVFMIVPLGHSRTWSMLSTARWYCFRLQQLGQLCFLLQVCGWSGWLCSIYLISPGSTYYPQCIVLMAMLECRGLSRNKQVRFVRPRLRTAYCHF